ncbi:MAG: HD domain-containing protein [Chlamydiales bacterium]|nr:HD domain-containing protein [Chlamydiales bacterium]NCF70945.1 HD domain-containing protein [Chlamydiales bacterium]
MNIFDPIHGFIAISEVEKALIATSAFQRLRYIHQMGLAYLVYPGASNKRFEHSLGTMQFASKIYRNIVMERNLEHLSQEDFPEALTPESRKYWKKIIRLAALCHDLGHVPFSHLLERIFIPKGSHEDFSYKMIQSPELFEVWKMLELKSAKQVALDVSKLALGEKFFEGNSKVNFTPWERVLSQIITDDNFGADRMDYLLRDSRYTGLAYGIFDYEQVLKLVKIVKLPSKRGRQNTKGYTLGIHIDALQATESLLLSRYFMFSRVYQNPKVNVFSLSMQDFVKLAFKKNIPLKSYKDLLAISDIQVLNEVALASKNKKHPAHKSAKHITERTLDYSYIRLNRSTVVTQALKKIKDQFKDAVYFHHTSLDEPSAHTPAVIYNDDNDVSFAAEQSSVYSQIPYAPSEIYLYFKSNIESKVKAMLPKAYR